MNGISSRNVVVRNYVHMQQTRKKTKAVAGHYYQYSSFPTYPSGSDGSNETCLKITHYHDKKTIKPHLTSDFIGPPPSSFTKQQKTWKTTQKKKSFLHLSKLHFQSKKELNGLIFTSQ